MEQEILILFARPYSFKNEEGQQLQGVTMYYLNKETTNSDKDGYGIMPVKVSLENANDLKHIPGKYKATFTVHPTAKGMQLKMSALEFIEKADVWNPSTK